jgi:hypothetical protein
LIRRGMTHRRYFGEEELTSSHFMLLFIHLAHVEALVGCEITRLPSWRKDSRNQLKYWNKQY